MRAEAILVVYKDKTTEKYIGEYSEVDDRDTVPEVFAHVDDNRMLKISSEHGLSMSGTYYLEVSINIDEVKKFHPA